MKIVILIARLLLGLIFVVFGLNGFLNFLSMGPPPTGLAGQFIGALFASHYYGVIAGLQIAGGLLLLVNRFVPLGLVLLGPDCEHYFVSPVLASGRCRPSNPGNHLMVHCVLRAPPVLLRDFCATHAR